MLTHYADDLGLDVGNRSWKLEGVGRSVKSKSTSFFQPMRKRLSGWTSLVPRLGSLVRMPA